MTWREPGAAFALMCVARASMLVASSGGLCNCLLQNARMVMQAKGHEFVFSGTVVKITKTTEYWYQATFEVDRVWKGSVPPRFDLQVSILGGEIPDFELGVRYVAVAQRLIDPVKREAAGLPRWGDSVAFAPVMWTEYEFARGHDSSRFRSGAASEKSVPLPVQNVFRKRQLRDEYRDRQPSLDAWVALGYDERATARILSLMSQAFRWSEADGLKLRPDDQVWECYHYYYPIVTGWRRWVGWSRPDELEMEALLWDLRKAARRRTVDLPASVTVGDLVKLIQG